MKTILSIFLLSLTLLPVASQAAPNEDVQPSNFLPPSQRERNTERAPRISQNQASDIVQESMPGSRVLNVQRDNQNWRVRIDREGNVSDVLVNAESGDVSRSNRE
jgi:uncharacterized membrane protein YkoI